MKQFRLLLTILTLLVVGSMNTWAETATLSISKGVTANGNLTDDKSNVWALSSDGVYTSNSSYIQVGTGKKAVTYLKLTSSAFSSQNISKIQVWGTSKANTGVTVKISIGNKLLGTSTAYTTQNASSGGSEFSVENTKNYTGDITIEISRPSSAKGAIYFNKAIVTYTTAPSCTKPTFTIADKTISLSEAQTGYDMSTNLTIDNKGGSTGAITYSCDNSDVNIMGDKFNTSVAGIYTINATMAADATYCEATTTFAITVQAASCTTLATPTGLTVSDLTPTSAVLKWDAVSNAAKYQIITPPPIFGANNTYETNEITYTATDLTPETEYKWTVKALGNGTTYCDSEESASGTFTTPAKPKYTIIWSTPTGTDTTQVTEGSAIGTLPVTNPTSCSSTYTNFVGWFTEAAGSESNPSIAKPATQVTAATVPTGDATYYAVFSDATGDGTWNLVTDVASLAVGDRIIIAAKTTDVAISTTQNTNNREETAITQNGSTLSTPSAEVQIFTLESGTKPDTWAFNTGSGYIYAASSSSNFLRTQEQNDDNGSWKITLGSSGSAATIKAQGTNSRNLLRYNSNSKLFSCYGSGQAEVVLYKQVSSATGYISFCTPCIKGTDDITVTSAQGIWVEAVTPLNITATNLDKNADGAKVTITATSLTGGFTLKTQGTNGSGSESVTLETGYSNSIYNANLTVVYSPTADNIIEEGKIALRVYRTNGTTTYATDTIIVRGRSLPAEFVLAAKTTNGWVALPADLGTSSTDAVKEPYTISVDDNAAPTKATLAPQSALYSAAIRSTVNTIPTGLRFAAGEKYLQGSTSTTTTNVWLSSTNSEQMQSWELHSSNLTDYFVRLRAAEEGRYLSYNATQGKIANYKQESRLHILPVEQTCMRYDAPNISVHALISTSVTFVWEAIAGVTDYEYSLDGEKTWQICSDIETLGTEVKWTLANLTSETKYTVYIRAKVADGKSNCSASDSETFTTPTCDDVPVDLWESATANAATIMWSAKAPTATVKIYADEQGTNLVKETLNATTPCKITGLEQNTDYYYQVLAGGSCASAIAHFKTESNEVSIVEWKKDAVIVDLNTEVTDADEVSILVEGQKTHGTNNNVADDLFFSKYYEATGNVKLVAIYNGTKDTLPLTNVKIKLGITSWDTKEISMAEYGEYKRGHIAPDEEIILWYYVKKDAIDEKIVSCVKNKIDVDMLNYDESNVSFSGRQTLALVRGSDIIDIMGAINTKDTNVDNVKPIKGNCEPSWGDITIHNKDHRTWCGTGYSLDDPTQEIELSMNRCLLVRSNKVHSGDSAVIKNVGAFKTFTKDEWLGRQVTKGDDNGVTESCNGFAYVADFNYNDYYTTYDSIANLEIKGNRNEDGTYTIPIPKLDTMACTNLRLQLKKKGTIQATREEKVPIIIYKTTDTKDSEFFGDKLTDEICKTCDVVVRDNAQLLHTAGGKQKFRDMYVYTGSSLNIPENQTMSLDKVRMFATNDSVSYAVINNSNDAAAAISVKEVSHVKRIDGRYWYPFSLPYDCNIADIVQLNGQPLGVYGTDWGIKYYDGQRRQSDGNSTTHYGEVSKYWTMMPEDGQLKAYTGYIIGLFVPAADEPLMKSVNFPPATESAYTENADSKTTPITNWSVNLTAKPRHHGWNFVGSPYISLFGSNNNTQGEGLYNTNVQMGWTDALGNQQDKDHIYVSIPDRGNSNTYTQALASGVTIRPFSAYFVQAIDPTNGQSNTLELRYSKTQRALPTLAPARTAKTDALILTELDITNGALGDNTGVLVSNVYSAEYEIGDDLTKMYAAAQKPQLYTTDAHNDKMAYQALPDVLAHAIPLGIYVPQAGDYTLSLNRYVSRLEAAEAVYLLHNGAVVANLLLSDYTVSASAKGTVSGYSLDIRRAPEVVTDFVPAAGDAPYIIARDGVLAIANLPADAIVQVYDVLGHQLLRADTPATATLQVPVPQTGVYTVVITTADGQQVLKTLLR